MLNALSRHLSTTDLVAVMALAVALRRASNGPGLIKVISVKQISRGR